MELQASPCGICTMINDEAKCLHEITSTTAMAKAVFHNKRAFFTSKLEFKLRKKHLSIAWYGAENWTLGK
jgi:hypothetical protein